MAEQDALQGDEGSQSYHTPVRLGVCKGGDGGRNLNVK